MRSERLPEYSEPQYEEAVSTPRYANADIVNTVPQYEEARQEQEPEYEVAMNPGYASSRVSVAEY